MRRIFIATICLVASICVSSTAETNQDRMTWFRDARFGMFIHWGLYAIPRANGRAGRFRASASGS